MLVLNAFSAISADLSCFNLELFPRPPLVDANAFEVSPPPPPNCKLAARALIQTINTNNSR